MKKWTNILLTAFFLLGSVHLAAVVGERDKPTIDYQLELQAESDPCIVAVLNGITLKHGQSLSKYTHGVISVQDETLQQIFFNITLKSQAKMDPTTPLYLRFTKLDQIDVQKVMEFAKIGDELFVEPYSLNGESCTPSRYIVN